MIKLIPLFKNSPSKRNPRFFTPPNGEFALSRWQCLKGHVFEGNFFFPGYNATEDGAGKLTTFVCPSCGEDMILSREEGVIELLNRVRDFVGQIAKDPNHTAEGTVIMTDVNRLEITIKRLAEEAARP